VSDSTPERIPRAFASVPSTVATFWTPRNKPQADLRRRRLWAISWQPASRASRRRGPCASWWEARSTELGWYCYRRRWSAGHDAGCVSYVDDGRPAGAHARL